MSAATPDLDDVLESFAFEAEGDPRALARYLRDFPQFASALIDCSLDIRAPMPDEDIELTAPELGLIEAGRSRLAAVVPTSQRNLFAGKAVSEMAAVARAVDVPRAVLLAIRDGGIVMSSVPRGWMRRLAAALNGTVEEVLASVGGGQTAARAYKSDARVEATGPMTFERALEEALVPEERRTALLAETD